MSELKQDLSYLILGQQGGENRIKILDHLKDRSYNINQLANTLDLNYRTIKHHIDILIDHDLITSSGEGYGDVYFISQKLEENYDLLQEMKRKHETISKSPEVYEKVIEQIHDGLILLDENKDIIFLNKIAEDITGYIDKELMGSSIEKLLESDIHQDLEQKVLTEDEFVEKMIEIETNSGEHKTINITMDYFHFDGEEHKGYSLLMKDITTEKTQREILNALMSHSEVMMAYLDLNFDLVYVNAAYAENTDHSPEELVGKNHFDLFPNGENKKLFEEVIEQGEKRSIKNRDLLQPNGSDQEGIYWALEPIKDEEEKVKGLVLSSYELGERES
ncbi:MAG: PAS domain-containing protein [Candidatus Natronoplasma sp.]